MLCLNRRLVFLAAVSPAKTHAHNYETYDLSNKRRTKCFIDKERREKTGRAGLVIGRWVYPCPY